jgi:hypothetical protein
MLRLRCARVVDQACGRLAQRLDTRLERCAGAGLEHELAPSGPQRRVDLDEHLSEPHGPVRGEELPAIRLVRIAEPLERRRERLGLEHERLWLVEDAEGRVDAGGEWMCAEQPTTEPVDRRHPGAVELEGEVGAPALDQLRADPRAQLSCRPLRVSDHEQRVDVEAVVHHRADESLDEDGRLASARAGSDEHAAVRVDRRALLGVGARLHGRSFRHMRQRSHQCGHSPPCGS